jgi:hypothetical protein
MKPLLPNLFESLFDFHPREDHSPKENFLTESFAYLLRTDDSIRNRWVSILLARKVEPVECEIITRQTENDSDADTPIYPDLLLEGHVSDGEKFAVYCEHKWDSPCNHGQLKRYRKVAEARGKHGRLVFVCANVAQRSLADKCFADKYCKCFLWEDVFTTLNGLANKSAMLKEFLDFMKTHGLSPGEPLTVETMRAFLHASNFLKSLLSMASKLRYNYPWTVIPKRFHAKTRVHDAYGRVGIRFETDEWKPALTVGFLYDETNHKVKLVNREKGIDLLLRIEAEPENTRNIQPALAVLNDKRKALLKTAASVLLKGERGNGNAYSVLIMQDCLGDVIATAKTEGEQLEVIHKRLMTWLQVLFGDGVLEKALKACRLDSGMK